MNIYFWMWWGISSLNNFISIWISTKCFKPKISTRLYILIMFVTWSAIPMILSALGPPFSDFKPISSVLIQILVAPLFMKERKTAVMLFFIINQILDFIFDLTVGLLIQIINPDFMSMDLQIYSQNRVIATLVYTLTIIPVKYIYYKLWNRIVNKERIDKVNGVYLLFPLGQAIVILCMMYQTISINTWSGISITTFTLIGFVLLAFIDYIFLFYLTDIEKNRRLKQELDRMEYAYNLEQEHYQSIESKRYEIAKIRHDIKNQLISVKCLVETENYAEAQELISGIEKNLDATAEYQYCSIPVINAVLHQKQQICADNNINFEADITVEDTGNLEQVHLCSIFSNLLDNSINANKKLNREVRYIKLFAQNKQGHIVISTENPIIDNVKKLLDPMQSSGYGLKILKDISEKYSGHFNISCENNICRAVISVCIEN